MPEDKLIVDLFWNRDENAIRILADKYNSDFVRISYNILNSREDSEECVNDAYLNTWNSIPQARPNSLYAYVGKIVRSLSINRLKSVNARKRGGGNSDLLLSELQECLAAGGSADETAECRELAGYISEFLWSVKRRDRALFLERYWCGMTVKDIAAKYQMTHKKVESILYRCRTKLRIYLEERGYCP